MIVQAKGSVPFPFGVWMCAKLGVTIIVEDAEKGVIETSDRAAALKIVEFLKANGYPYATIEEEPQNR